MLTIVEKEKRRKAEIHQRALAFEIAQRSAAYVKNLREDNRRLVRTTNELQDALNSLRSVMSSAYKEQFKHYAARGLSRMVIDKFRESAKEIFNAYAAEDMARVAKFCLDNAPRGLPFEVYKCFDQVLDAMDLAFEPEDRGPFRGGSINTKFTIFSYWPHGQEFRIPIELDERRIDGVKKLKEAHQNQSS